MIRVSGRLPEARYGHTLNIIGSRLYVFGGRQSRSWWKNPFLNNIYSIDLDDLSQNKARAVLVQVKTSLPPRSRHTCVSISDKLIVFYFHSLSEI